MICKTARVIFPETGRVPRRGAGLSNRCGMGFEILFSVKKGAPEVGSPCGRRRVYRGRFDAASRAHACVFVCACGRARVGGHARADMRLRGRADERGTDRPTDRPMVAAARRWSDRAAQARHGRPANGRAGSVRPQRTSMAPSCASHGRTSRAGYHRSALERRAQLGAESSGPRATSTRRAAGPIRDSRALRALQGANGYRVGGSVGARGPRRL